MKALSSGGLPDVALQAKAADKLACVQKLLSNGASLLSQVGQRSFLASFHIVPREGH